MDENITDPKDESPDSIPQPQMSENQRQLAEIFSRVYSKNPDGVVIISIGKEGVYQVEHTPLPLEVLAFTETLLRRFIIQALNDANRPKPGIVLPTQFDSKPGVN